MYELKFIDGTSGDILWTRKDEDLELLVGMIAGGIAGLGEQNDRYYFDINTNINKYRVKELIFVDDLEVNSEGWLNDDEYGLWVLSHIPYRYNLYKFRTDSFFRGLILVLNIMELNYMDYTYKYIFDKNMKLYFSTENGMVANYIIVDSYEDPAFEYEEDIDENVIEPLNKEDYQIVDEILSGYDVYY